MDLIADIGATNSRFALLDDDGRQLALETFENALFTGVEGLLDVYLSHRRASDQPKRAALAIAAPIVGDEVRMSNRPWGFSRAALKEKLNLNELIVINDFAAVAWALPALSAGDLAQIGGGAPLPRSTLATLGPGSGLGVASVTPAADDWAVVAAEGGHATLPATNDAEAAVVERVRKRYGHCSAERLLSGPGLVTLYETLAEIAGRPVAKITPPDVTGLARQGEPLATRTVGMFLALLGNVAGNLALTVGALGGVYVAGGIVPRLLDTVERSDFRERFEAKGRYRHYMERIPTYVITARLPALNGLRRLLGHR